MLISSVGLFLALAGFAISALATSTGFVFGLGWLVLIAAVRSEAIFQIQPSTRIVMDGALIILCLAGGTIGGWYFVPAVVAFAAADNQSEPSRHQSVPSVPYMVAVVALMILSTVAASLAIAVGGSLIAPPAGSLAASVIQPPSPVARVGSVAAMSGAVALMAFGVIALRSRPAQALRAARLSVGTLIVAGLFALSGAVLLIPAIIVSAVALRLFQRHAAGSGKTGSLHADVAPASI